MSATPRLPLGLRRARLLARAACNPDRASGSTPAAYTPLAGMRVDYAQPCDSADARKSRALIPRALDRKHERALVRGGEQVLYVLRVARQHRVAMFAHQHQRRVGNVAALRARQ
jgi:hypothetical protein